MSTSLAVVIRVLYSFLTSLARLAVRSGRSKDLEIIVLRHENALLGRQINRPAVNDDDRTLQVLVDDTQKSPVVITSRQFAVEHLSHLVWAGIGFDLAEEPQSREALSSAFRQLDWPISGLRVEKSAQASAAVCHCLLLPT